MIFSTLDNNIKYLKEKVEHTQTLNALLQILQDFKLYSYSIVSRTIDTDDTYQDFKLYPYSIVSRTIDTDDTYQDFKLYPYSIVSRTIDTDDTYQGFNPIMPVATKNDVQTIFVISMYH